MARADRREPLLPGAAPYGHPRSPTSPAFCTKHPASDPALRDLIERLPLRERAILVLHYGHGYTLEEIAGTLSLSYANVRTLLSRTRRRMYRDWKETDR